MSRWQAVRTSVGRTLVGHDRAYEELGWQAVQRGFLLTRESRLWGALYALTPVRGETRILYDLGEVRGFLERDRSCTCTPV